jgi:hypothetical protein
MKRCITNALVIGVVFVGILVAMVGTPVAAQTPQVTDRQAILFAEQAYQEAVAKGDKAAIEKLLDKDFEWAANRTILTKAETLKNVAALKSEKGGADFLSIARLTPRYYSGQVGVLYRLDADPRLTHIWVKRPEGWRAFLFFNLPMLAGPEPVPNPHPVNNDMEATTNCHNPCNYLPWDDKIAGRPVTTPEKEALASWQTQKHTESIPNDQAAINAWETRTADDGFLLYNNTVTHYIIASRLWDLIRMWKGHITAPGGPFVISMHVWALGDDCVIYTALQHPSEHVTNSTSYAVRIWTKKRPPFYGIRNPNPLPWESDHIWQIALSEAVDVANGTVEPKH